MTNVDRATWRITCVGASAAATLAAACASGARPSTDTPPASTTPAGVAAARPDTTAARPPAWIAKMDSGRVRFSAADVEFMQGMIHHHAQAILMAGWAPSHGASPAIRELCARIVVAQRDEIAFAQRWLRERNQEVPDADTSHFMMSGMDMKLMPGMLTPEQLKRLDASRGKEFDRRLLELMIVHHQGAIAMVEKLFQSQGATQDESVFKFASDVDADQRAEIDRMERMLRTGSLAVPPGSP